MKSSSNLCSDIFIGIAISGVLLATSLCGCGDSSNASGNIGTISTVAGTGTYGYSGDGGLATAAQLNQPTCAVLDKEGNPMLLSRFENKFFEKL